MEASTLKRVATFYILSDLRAKRVVRGTARVVSNMQNASPQCTFPVEVVHCRNEWVLHEMFQTNSFGFTFKIDISLSTFTFVFRINHPIYLGPVFVVRAVRQKEAEGVVHHTRFNHRKKMAPCDFHVHC